MRATRTSLSAVLAAVLMAGMAIGTAGQEEVAAPVEAVFHVELNFFEPEQVIVDEVSGQTILINAPFRASDPRASGLLTSVWAQKRINEGRARYTQIKEGLRLVNDGGAWVGTGTRLIVNEKDQRTRKQKRKGRGKEPINLDQRLMELTGEGGYEGLSMVIAFRGPIGEGVIVPTEAVPTQPQPPTPELSAD